MSFSAVSSIQETSTSTLFCDQNFQDFRVLANSVSRRCIGIFYKIISSCSWIFSQSTSHHFNSLSIYHFSRAVTEPSAFLRHGSRVVDFATNITTRVKEIDGENEIDALKRMYGNETIALWSEIGNQEIPLNQSKLTRLEMVDDGCCYGMSLDFISHYLKKIKEGKMPMEAVKAIAPRYVEGAPDEAQLLQIFSSALDLSKIEKAYQKTLEPKLDAFRRETKKWFREEREKIFKLTPDINGEEHRNRMANHQAELAQRMKNLKNGRVAGFTEMSSDKAKIAFQRNKIGAEKVGLSTQLVGLCTIEEAESQAMGPNFQHFVDQLPQGVYHVSLSPNEKVGHSIVFINTGDLCFIHEPNYATLALSKEEAAKELWNIGKELYLTNDLCSMSFSSMTLN